MITPEPWTCHRCGMVNFGDIAECETCRNVNPVLADDGTRQPYWYCDYCYTGNPQGATFCRTCTTIRTI